MQRAIHAGFILCLLGLVALPASADTWEQRVEALVKRLESGVGKLDGKTPATGAIAKRLVDLDQRVGALEEKAGRPKQSESIIDSGEHDPLLSNWTAAATSLGTRLQALTAPPKPPAEPAPKPPPASVKPPAAPRERAVALRYPILRDYDRFKDLTTLKVELPIEGDDFKLSILGGVEGTEANPRRSGAEAPQVLWMFIATQESWRFLYAHDLALLAQPDSRRFEASGDHDGRVRSGYVLEFITITMDLGTFLDLARSRTLEGRLGRAEFTFSADALRSMAALGAELARLCPPPKADAPEAAPAQAPEAPAPASLQPKGTGTAFFVTREGHLVTNDHVTAGGSRYKVVSRAGRFDARLVKSDAANDLAVLKVDGDFAAMAITASRDVRLGSTVATLGFPNPELQGFSPKLAKGEIAGLAGVKDDARYFQISVPLQPGNSGGPLFDELGNVVGVVSAKLSERAARATSGAAAENVNYAVKSTFVLSLLESIPGLAEKLPPPSHEPRAFEDVVKAVQDATVLIEVY